METEYSSYRLGLTEKRAGWLVAWLRENIRARNVTAKEMARRYLPELGEAFPKPAIRLVFRYPRTPGPHDDTTRLKVLFSWLADRLEGGDPAAPVEIFFRRLRLVLLHGR